MGVYIETDRVILRDWAHDDLEHFARINEDHLVMEYYPSRLDEEASARLMANFQEHIDQKGYGFFAAEEKGTGTFMGFAGLAAVPENMPFAPAIELAWRFDYDFWGKGLATEVARALISYGFDDLKLDSIVAYCLNDNIRAIPALETLGFAHKASKDFKYAMKRSPKKKLDYRFYTLSP